MPKQYPKEIRRDGKIYVRQANGSYRSTEDNSFLSTVVLASILSDPVGSGDHGGGHDSGGGCSPDPGIGGGDSGGCDGGGC